MCLRNSHFIPKFALKDIPVKKLLVLNHSFLETPYMGQFIIEKRMKPSFTPWSTVFFDILKRNVGEGFIHSYSPTKPIIVPLHGEKIIMDAYIPKGSWYFTEKYFGKVVKYASTRLILKPAGDYLKYFIKR